MSNPIVIAKNNTDSAITMNDLSGVTIDSTSQIILTDIFKFYDLSNSINLKTYVTNGNIIINNGTSDLSIENGLKHVSTKSEYEIITNNFYRSSAFPDSTSCIWFNYNDNIIYIWDTLRNKWLSSYRTFVTFSNHGNTNGQYISNSSSLSANTGFLIYKPATIISIWGKATSGNNSKIIRIYDNDEILESFTLSNLYYKSSTFDLDIGNSEDTYLRIFIDSAGQNIKNPVIQLEIAWRYVSS